MTPEFKSMEPALEQAVAEIRDEAISDAMMEAAAARVWVRLSEAAAVKPVAHSTIRNCSDFQALMPDLRAGLLSDARATLLRDHMHQCVACRHIYEGKVVSMPAPAAVRRPNYTARWAVAATALLTAGVAAWWAMGQFGGQMGTAIVQSLDGNLYVVSADGLHPLKMGDKLPMDGELKTSKDADAVLQLADGSKVEMRERSSLSTSASGNDITVHLGSGSILVEAAHRSQGHLYVNTADCRVAVTGTVFGVTAGVKGSRVSVVQGEVHVTQDNQEKVLHAGDSTVTNASVEQQSVSSDLAWSKSRADLLKVVRSLQQVRMPELRYESKMLARLPAATTLFISIPNLSQYLKDAEDVLSKKLGANPQLRAVWNNQLRSIVETVRTGSEYLGEEIDIAGALPQAPVLFAEQKKEGFEEFLRKKGVPIVVINRGGLLVFGPDRPGVEAAAAQLDSGFANAPLYGRIQHSYEEGAGLLVWADLEKLPVPVPGARYFFAEQKQTATQTVASAAIGFDGPRTGLAAQLAPPSPMNSLDYVSPDTIFVLGFAVKNPVAIVQAALSMTRGNMQAAQQELDQDKQEKGFSVGDDLAASLGGEFAIAMDGSLMPVPSWKLVSEIYDPARFQATIQKFADSHNQHLANGGKRIVLGQETIDGRVYYSIAQENSGPLLEGHYTFDRGYLVAGPTTALVSKALSIKTSRNSIKQSSKFLELAPRDQYLNFSAVIYQNLGTSLAPLAMFASSMMPSSGAANHGSALASLGSIKPSLYAVYGEPDRITMKANGDVIGSMLGSLLSGNLRGMAGIPMPGGQMVGTPAVR